MNGCSIKTQCLRGSLRPASTCLPHTSLHCSTCRLSSGIVPTSYKDAYVIPRLNKSTLPCGDLSSYRPISNLPFLSKLLERVVSVQLTDYLSSAGLLPVHQSAYRKFHSTETALLKVVRLRLT